MPLFHLSAAPTVLAPMLVGGTSVLADGFHPARVWDEIRACGAAGFAGRAPWCRCCGTCRRIRATADLPLRFLSAAPISADLYRDIERSLRLPHRDDVRDDRSLPDRLQGGVRRGRAGNLGTGQSRHSTCALSIPTANSVPQGMVGEIVCRARTTHAMSEGYVSSAPGGRVCSGRPAPRVVPHRRPRQIGRRPEPDLCRPGQGLAAQARRERVVGRGRVDGDAPSRGAGSGGRWHPQ